jgi:uncharacterized integral membrane protein (TIGR00697 family)
MNEALFFFHAIVILFFTRIALHLGKTAISCLIVLEVILANLFVNKQITLFSLEITPTDAYTIGAIVGINLLQEHFGRENAKKLTSTIFLLLLFFIGMSLFQTHYTPSKYDSFHPFFIAILSTTPRIFLSSIFSLFLTQRLDIELFSRLRKRFSLQISMAISLIITQAFDNILFTFLALSGTVHSMISIITLSYVIKLLVFATMSPFMRLFPKKKDLPANV